jgi:ADP-ribosylation factor-binding protein GGA
MLKNQGVVKETPPPLPPEDSYPVLKVRAKSAIFEDDAKSKLLQKLLQSKKPEDLQHANRLIKTMVREVFTFFLLLYSLLAYSLRNRLT